MSAEATAPADAHGQTSGSTLERSGWTVASIVVVFGLAAVVRFLDANASSWFPSATWLKSVEFPVYAIAVGLVAGPLIAGLGLPFGQSSSSRPAWSCSAHRSTST